MDELAPNRVLVVAAHPDDIDFGAAGTIARWTREGSEVVYVIITDGDAGGFDTSVDRSQIPSIRRAEQQAAAKVVGVETVEFLGYPDGRLVADFKLRADLSRMIRLHLPDRVLCPSPMRDLSRIPASHPDHLAAGEAALCAIYPDARNPFAFTELLAEGLEAHIVHDVWLMGHPERNRYVDITETIDDKITALGSHESQLPDPETTFGFVRAFLAANAVDAGLGEEHFAEAFFTVAVP